MQRLDASHRSSKNKEMGTLLSILCANVYNGAIFYTYEHKAFFNLCKNNFKHGTVCYKYNLVDSTTNVDTQAVESFHKKIKRKRKKVSILKTRQFFNEFCFYIKNRSYFSEKILNLIKMLIELIVHLN